MSGPSLAQLQLRRPRRLRRAAALQGLQWLFWLLPLLPLGLPQPAASQPAASAPAASEPACANGLFIVQLEDRPDRAALRQRLVQDHRRWVASMQARIVAAGSLHAQPQDPAQGGLWLVRGSDPAEVRALVQQDPFWRGGLRRSLQIRFWCRGFPAGPASL